jgi:hypothetical protein
MANAFSPSARRLSQSSKVWGLVVPVHRSLKDPYKVARNNERWDEKEAQGRQYAADEDGLDDLVTVPQVGN